MKLCRCTDGSMQTRHTHIRYKEHTYLRTYIFLLWGAILYTVNTILRPIFLYIVINWYAVYASEKKLNRVLWRDAGLTFILPSLHVHISSCLSLACIPTRTSIAYAVFRSVISYVDILFCRNSCGKDYVQSTECARTWKSRNNCI